MAIMLSVVSVLSTARIRAKLTRGIDLHEPESLGVDGRVACGVNQLKAKFPLRRGLARHAGYLPSLRDLGASEGNQQPGTGVGLGRGGEGEADA